MDVLTQSLVGGILIGGLYALMAVGLSLVWGVLRLINLALLGVTLISAYITYELASVQGWDPLVTILVLVPLMGALSFGLQWLFDVMRLEVFQSLLVTFGILTIVIAAAQSRWSADFRQIPRSSNPYIGSSLQLGNMAFPIALLLAFGAAALLGIGIHVYLRRSMFGKAVRAIAEDREMAQVLGVDYVRVSRWTAAAAGALAAIAGALVAIVQALHPNVALEWLGIVFPVVILGGIGSALGSVVAGVIIGSVSAVAAVTIGAAAAPLATFLMLILTLLLRPQGLFGSEIGG